MWLFWLGVSLGAPLERVVPTGRELGLQMGAHWLPRDSMVSASAGVCDAQERSVKVVTVDPWYRVPGVTVVPPGTVGCVAADSLTGAKSAPGDPVMEAQVRAAYVERFGPIEETAIKSTPWGRIALPMAHEFSAAELQDEIKREKLQTPKQRERAVVAMGPEIDGHAVYAHFLGSDAPRSDRWGRPDTVIRLMDLSLAWAKHCRSVLPASIPEAGPETCLVQYGDLAWYNDRRPDPLGHRDHYAGTCVDIRLFRTKPSRYEAWWNRPDDRPGASGGYSQALTAAFLAFAVQTAEPTVIHFNDPAVQENVPFVTPARGHDDHVHMCF